eukprot:297122-Amphidinium_carterae.1
MEGRTVLHVRGFEFCEKSSLKWGLHQRQGGPCGVYAPVQGIAVTKDTMQSSGIVGNMLIATVPSWVRIGASRSFDKLFVLCPNAACEALGVGERFAHARLHAEAPPL